MSRQFRPCLFLSLLGLLVGSVEAAPIRVTVVGDPQAFPAAPQYSIVTDGVMSQSPLLNVPASSNAFGMHWEWGWRPGNSGAHAGLSFIFDRLEEGTPVSGSPTVTVKATLSGETFLDHSGRPQGVLSLHSFEASLANWSEDSDIPRSVVDAFLDPDRVQFSAYSRGRGGNGYFEVYYTVQPVPEPATWAVWALSGLAMLTLRHPRKTRRTELDREEMDHLAP